MSNGSPRENLPTIPRSENPPVYQITDSQFEEMLQNKSVESLNDEDIRKALFDLLTQIGKTNGHMEFYHAPGSLYLRFRDMNSVIILRGKNTLTREVSDYTGLGKNLKFTGAAVKKLKAFFDSKRNVQSTQSSLKNLQEELIQWA